MKMTIFIKESISLYLSPIVCVPKPDGALQVFIDFCMANQDIFNDEYSTHRIEEQLEAMAGSRVFMTLEFTKGYYHLVLHPDSKPFTVFLTPERLYQWKFLPLGMNATVAVFQRVMDQIMGDLQPRCVSVYINDINIYSFLLEQHLVNLGKVFARLKAADLKFSVDKTNLAKESVLVLGHIVSASSISPNPNRIQDLVKIARPC